MIPSRLYTITAIIVKAPREYLKSPKRIPETRIGLIPDKNLEMIKLTPQRRMIVANNRYGLLDGIVLAVGVHYLELVVDTILSFVKGENNCF